MKNDHVIIIVVIIAAFCVIFGLVGNDGKKAEKDKTVYAPKTDQIAGFNGVSTRFDTTKESLSAPTDMTTKGVRNNRIDKDSSSVQSQGYKAAASTGATGMKIQ
jgi:hypothetical protein